MTRPRRRKLGCRQLERAQREFREALTAVIVEAGATEGSFLGYEYTLQTQAGELGLRVRPACDGHGGFVATMFRDVERACKFFGLDKMSPRERWDHRLNSFSGKWNLNYYGVNADVLGYAQKNLRWELAKVLPRQEEAGEQ